MNLTSSISLVALSLAVPSFAQTDPTPATTGKLTLNEAIRLARLRNGTISAAVDQYLAARQRTIQARASFFPTVTPSYSYISNRQQFIQNGSSFFQQNEGSSTQIASKWRLVDLGERQDNFLSARRSEDSQYFNAAQTFRLTLFDVEQQYYETLRATELQKVADSQVIRAQGILDQTTELVRVGRSAAKDILQVKADFGNARVTQIQARNATVTAAANLKSFIGYPSENALPALESIQDPDLTLTDVSLKTVLASGLRDRPDLIAQRKNVESQQFNQKLLNRQAGVSAAIDLGYTQSITPDSLQDRGLQLLITYPLFDGGASRANARASMYSVRASQRQLEQSERVAAAEIESAYVVVSQDVERIKAADEALIAAKENYQKAVDSQAKGASDIIAVLTAQVSLATAESNRIQAVYDFEIANLRFSLATGRPIYGQSAIERVPNIR